MKLRSSCLEIVKQIYQFCLSLLFEDYLFYGIQEQISKSNILLTLLLNQFAQLLQTKIGTSVAYDYSS